MESLIDAARRQTVTEAAPEIGLPPREPLATVLPRIRYQ